MGQPDGPSVLVAPAVVEAFLDEAVLQYRDLERTLVPNSCFAVLLGIGDRGLFRIEDLAFGRNVRASSPTAVEEFSATIAPRYGAEYENPGRGYWLDSQELFTIDRRARRSGLQILGSVHMHPDWQRMGPPPAQTKPLSERPTPMDEYVFQSAGWPVNLICFMERAGGILSHTLQAWSSGVDDDGSCRALPLRMRSENRARREVA